MVRKLFLAAALAAGLAACATATPYQPNIRGTATTGGFSEHRIESDRWRVNFAGNSLTSRERVETYLLYRAAELTLEQGYDTFRTVDRDTERQSRIVVDSFGPRYGAGFGGGFGYGGPRFGFGYGGFWRPSWRYYGRGYGWRGWDPYFGGPFWADQIDVRQVDRYEANAEIVMSRGGGRSDDSEVFSAREVVENLRPQIEYPQPRR